MRPDHAAHRREVAARHTFKQPRVIPELELDDVGRACEVGHLLETIGADNVCATGLDALDKAAVTRRLEEDEGLLDGVRQRGADRRVRLAYAAPQMRRDVQDFHSAATAA